jgi:C4-dicarboxylate-specific signal transduction histidine kinase
VLQGDVKRERRAPAPPSVARVVDVMVTVRPVVRWAILVERREVDAVDVQRGDDGGGAAPRVVGDRAALERVLLNLVLNALRARERAGTCARVWLPG